MRCDGCSGTVHLQLYTGNYQQQVYYDIMIYALEYMQIMLSTYNVEQEEAAAEVVQLLQICVHVLPYHNTTSQQGTSLTIASW